MVIVVLLLLFRSQYNTSLRRCRESKLEKKEEIIHMIYLLWLTQLTIITC